MRKNRISFALAISILTLTTATLLPSCSNKGGGGKDKTIEIGKATDMNAEEFKKGLESDKDAVLLDVRTAGEYMHGAIAGAQNMDFNASDFKTKAEVLDREKPVYVYCASGPRSSSAATVLTQMGFKKVYALEKGTLAWNNAGYELFTPNPVSAKTDAENKDAIPDSDKNPTKLTLDGYKAIVAKYPSVLIDFNADWCAPCRELRPSLDKLEAEGKFTLISVNTDKNRELAKTMKVESLPTICYYKDGKLKWTENKWVPEDYLRRKF